MQTVFKESYIPAETIYTYSEWKKEHSRRNQHKKEISQYYFKQKLAGIIMAAIGVLTPILLNGDATISIIALPLGLYLICTKQHVMTF